MISILFVKESDHTVWLTLVMRKTGQIQLEFKPGLGDNHYNVEVQLKD